jgi:lipoate-protein ligase A
VPRPTGGKAVLHGHDATIGLAVPFAELGLGRDESRSVAVVYRQIVGLLVRALQDCGADVALGEDTRFVRSEGHTADCFAHVSPNDIVDPKTGQKTCGCALRVGQASVLVQASVPTGRPLVNPGDVFVNPSAASWTKIDPVALAEALDACLSGTVAGRR